MDITEFARLEDQNQYARHPWETSRKNVLLELLKDSGISFPVERIVDIGSGDAFVIHSLLAEQLAHEYFAIDTAYTPELIRQLKSNNRDSKVNYVQDLQTYFGEHQSNAKTLYLCMDVLEHLPDEAIILDHLKKGDHHYFFAVPAFQSVFSSHDVLLGHYRRYTLKQFSAMLAKHGFEIRKKGYYFTSLLCFRYIEKVLRKNKEASLDNWNGGKSKSALVNAMLSTDFAITSSLKRLGITIPGLSCYCLCRK